MAAARRLFLSFRTPSRHSGAREARARNPYPRIFQDYTGACPEESVVMDSGLRPLAGPGMTLLQRRQTQRLVHQRARPLEIEIAIKMLLRHERRPAIEFFVLRVAAAEFGAEEIPNKPHQLDARPGVGRAGAHVAVEVGGNFGILEIGVGGGQRDESRAR